MRKRILEERDEIDVGMPEDENSSNTAFTQYLREIGRIPLFSAEQEQEMNGLLVAARKKYNAALRQKKQDPKNKRIKEQWLQAKRELEAVKNESASHNLRLVVSLARQYRSAGRLEDRVQNGNQGLMKALKKFKPGLGFRFSTYASWWIRQFIVRVSHDTGHTIRRPVHLSDQINWLHKAQIEAAKLPVNGKSSEEILCALTGYTPEKLRQMLLLQNGTDTLSLDAPIEADGTTTYGAVIPDLKSLSPEETLARNQTINLVRSLIKDLDPRSQLIIKSRFGIGRERITTQTEKDEPTLEEVGRVLGITRERIRQIQEQALSRLRSRYKTAS